MSTEFQYPVLRVTEMPSIGMPMAEARPSGKRPDVDWMQPLVDIYAEVLENQRILRQIQERINTPWYIRLGRWFLSFVKD